jgi:hypothetical protein
VLRRLATLVLTATLAAQAQVYSPHILKQGQPDPWDLAGLAQGIYQKAGATTPRQRAEAVWRFFLTDGRFVEPGFWYHIAGWAYEEPGGEVLDPIKLVNSYGFGLCYQIAPLLEAVWKAGGFEDARVWFLTGHTVAEVFYDGGYHYFDSDMMGYNPVAGGRVASVRELEQDGSIILGKMRGPREVATAAVSSPWYPADVRAGAMDGLAELFTTSRDNWLFPFKRAPRGHTMDFVLRPGERMTLNFQPERDDLFYLPYKFNGSEWVEFPQEIAQYGIRTPDGPRSQKDARRWATGRLEYDVPVTGEGAQVIEVRSPYVIIDARFTIEAQLRTAGDRCTVETSADGGRTWTPAASRHGPRSGVWKVEPATLTRSAHGRRTAVSGLYTYHVRISRTAGAALRRVLLVTRFQLNPRTLPALENGRNALAFSQGAAMLRREAVSLTPGHTAAATLSTVGGQYLWTPRPGATAELLYRLDASPSFAAIEAGARFLDLRAGLAPDKFTAEARPIAAPAASADAAASIAWSATAGGPFATLWEYEPRLEWRDGIAVERVLRWPEVDRRVTFPRTVPQVWVRYRFRGMAMDSARLAAETPAAESRSVLNITHQWTENGRPRAFTRRVRPGARYVPYVVETRRGARIGNRAIVLECPRGPRFPAGTVKSHATPSR